PEAHPTPHPPALARRSAKACAASPAAATSTPRLERGQAGRSRKSGGSAQIGKRAWWVRRKHETPTRSLGARCGRSLRSPEDSTTPPPGRLSSASVVGASPTEDPLARHRDGELGEAPVLDLRRTGPAGSRAGERV